MSVNGLVARKPPMRFLPRGSGMVPHYEALLDSPAHRIRAFRGWKHDASIGDPVDWVDEVTGRSIMKTGNSGAFVKQLGEVFEIPFESKYRAEYIRHARDKDLWPADAYTAQLVGVKFDPTFGGEHTDEAKKAHEAMLADLRKASARPELKPAPQVTAPPVAPAPAAPAAPVAK